MSDLYNNLLVKETLPIATRTNGTATGTAVDRGEDKSGFQGVMVVVHTGTMTDGSVVIEVQDSDASGSGFAPVADQYLQGTEPTIAATDDNKIYELGYIGPKRYIKTVAVTTGATSGGTFGSTVLLGDPDVSPVVRN